MRTLAITAMLCFAAASTGCVTKEELVTKFDPTQAAYAAKSGTGSVKGQAFARQRGGGVVTAAGEQVYLLPDVSPFREMAEKGRAGIEFDMPKFDGDKYLKATIADAEGRFSFSNLHPGKYIALTKVQWMAGDLVQGGMVYAEASVEAGKVAEVIARR
jgi:hypothetical protein